MDAAADSVNDGMELFRWEYSFKEWKDLERAARQDTETKAPITLGLSRSLRWWHWPLGTITLSAIMTVGGIFLGIEYGSFGMVVLSLIAMLHMFFFIYISKVTPEPPTASPPPESYTCHYDNLPIWQASCVSMASKEIDYDHQIRHFAHAALQYRPSWTHRAQ